MKTTFTLLFLFFFICAGTSFAQWSYSYDEYGSASVDSSSNFHVSVVMDGTTYGSCWANGGTYMFPNCPASHQPSAYNVLTNTTQGTSAGGNHYGPYYDMFDYISWQDDTSLFWSVGDAMSAEYEAYVYCSAAFAAILDTGLLTLLDPAVACPGSVSVQSVQQEVLANVFPRYLTGIGATTEMQVGPCCNLYDGAIITENVSLVSSATTCPSSFGPFCTDKGTFVVGAGPFRLIDGTLVPKQTNAYEDQHSTTGSVSALDVAGINSCNIVCTQTYSCRNYPIGTFTITRSLTKGTMYLTTPPTPITNVTVTKQ